MMISISGFISLNLLNEGKDGCVRKPVSRRAISRGVSRNILTAVAPSGVHVPCSPPFQ